ncbi:MAG TPA: CRISPR-associated endonuclease Cas2 [Candidatus Marinimicrobia bacterium]|jgi:CRISPR-associated protein Cas2|nr:CRISPR-associated endonuclease Cas2 [Candidatus Neomarinimicrobiota bacterium]HQQ85881.1 CRISPR-associated endonuclease Cas2 [Candidatus Neomarinimicrobiota bacterium]
MFYVVSYDIKDDKRRLKIAKTLLDFGTRVQYSVFECNLNDKQIQKLQDKINNLIDNRADTVRIYSLCEACHHRVTIHGTGVLTEDADLYVF